MSHRVGKFDREKIQTKVRGEQSACGKASLGVASLWICTEKMLEVEGNLEVEKNKFLLRSFARKVIVLQ